MTEHTEPKPPFWTRLLAGFLLWTAGRAVYSLYLGQADSDYRFASEAGFGPALWAAEALYAFLAIGAGVGIWARWRHTAPLALVATALYSSILIFQLWQAEQHPDRARQAYAESRRARGFPLPEERLDVMFSPKGRRMTWILGGLFALGPLVLVLWRRRDLE